MGDNLFNTFSFDTFKKNKKTIKKNQKAEVSKKKKIKDLRLKLEERKEAYVEKKERNPIEGTDLSEILAEYERRKTETGADSGSEWEFEDEGGAATPGGAISAEVRQEAARRLTNDDLPPAPVFRYNRLHPRPPSGGRAGSAPPPSAAKAPASPSPPPLRFNFNRRYPFEPY